MMKQDVDDQDKKDFSNELREWLLNDAGLQMSELEEYIALFIDNQFTS